MTDPDAPWWKPGMPMPAQMPAQIDHYAEAVRLLALADTIGALLCEQSGTLLGHYKADRLNAARDAHLQAAQVHATLAGPRPLELRAVVK